MRLGPFPLGMNNKAPDHALPEGAVRNIVNSDVDNTGKARRRSGMTKVYSATDVRYGFSCSIGTFTVEAGSLRKIEEDWASTIIKNGVNGSTFAFHEFNGNLYFSDGVLTAKITESTITNWGMHNPSMPAAYTDTGSFGAGVYLYAITYVDSVGNESGASVIGQVTASDNSSFTIRNIPVSTDPQVVSVRVYLSTANGKTLFQCAEIENGTTSCNVIFDYDNGKELQTNFLTMPPPGQIIREFNGRMIIAHGSVLSFTEPYSPDLVSQLSKDKMVFGADITIVEPVVDGVWVVADKTYFLLGTGPDDFIQQTKLDYGAALGTGQKMPNSNAVTWFSTRGQIVAGNAGELKNVQEENVSPDTANSGAMLIRESNGIRQAITSLKNPTMSAMAASSFINAEVIRRA